MIYIGLDEAGLGPTLGPMVIAGFSVTGVENIFDLAETLKEAIGPPGSNSPQIEVGDSKLIHRGTRKLARIERTVLATLGWLHGSIPRTSCELMQWTDRGLDSDNQVPWYNQSEESLPIAASLSEIEDSIALLSNVAKQRGITPLAFNANVVSEHRFNRELKQEYINGGSKNTWSTQQVVNHAGYSVGLLNKKNSESDDIEIECDRAGARMMYSPQIVHRFRPKRVEIVQETNHRSQYKITGFQDHSPSRKHGHHQQLAIAFQVRADSVFAHVAWASCLAKYLREIVMRGFNRYWINQHPDLKPTAGYPQDAKRFVNEIRTHSSRQNFSDHQWIRMA